MSKSIVLDVWKSGRFTWTAEWRWEDDPLISTIDDWQTKSETYEQAFTRRSAIRKARRTLQRHHRYFKEARPPKTERVEIHV